MSILIDSMEYASDGAAQAAYVSDNLPVPSSKLDNFDTTENSYWTNLTGGTGTVTCNSGGNGLLIATAASGTDVAAIKHQNPGATWQFKIRIKTNSAGHFQLYFPSDSWTGNGIAFGNVMRIVVCIGSGTDGWGVGYWNASGTFGWLDTIWYDTPNLPINNYHRLYVAKDATNYVFSMYTDADVLLSTHTLPIANVYHGSEQGWIAIGNIRNDELNHTTTLDWLDYLYEVVPAHSGAQVYSEIGHTGSYSLQAKVDGTATTSHLVRTLGAPSDWSTYSTLTIWLYFSRASQEIIFGYGNSSITTNQLLLTCVAGDEHTWKQHTIAFTGTRNAITKFGFIVSNSTPTQDYVDIDEVRAESTYPPIIPTTPFNADLRPNLEIRMYAGFNNENIMIGRGFIDSYDLDSSTRTVKLTARDKVKQHINRLLTADNITNYTSEMALEYAANYSNLPSSEVDIDRVGSVLQAWTAVAVDCYSESQKIAEAVGLQSIFFDESGILKFKPKINSIGGMITDNTNTRTAISDMIYESVSGSKNGKVWVLLADATLGTNHLLVEIDLSNNTILNNYTVPTPSSGGGYTANLLPPFGMVIGRASCRERV